MPNVNGKKYPYTAKGKAMAKAAAKKSGAKMSYGKAKSKKSPKPTNPSLYSRVKAEAKKKFDVWPSAYASGWLTKEYKRRGGKYSG